MNLFSGIELAKADRFVDALAKATMEATGPAASALETRGSEGDHDDSYRIETFLCSLLRFRNGSFAYVFLVMRRVKQSLRKVVRAW
jgi:hypothetical protein